MTLLPIAAPAILLGIGVVALWNHDATAGLYDSGAMAVILFVGRFCAFSVLVSSGAVAALEPELEESAAIGGAPPWRRLVSIVAPLLRGSLAASFILVFVFAITQLTHYAAHHLDVVGVVRSALVFWLIWWGWTQFTWALNAANTDHHEGRVGTLVSTAVAFAVILSEVIAP